MSRVFSAVKLDFYSAKTNLRIGVIMFAVSILLGVLTKRPVLIIIYNMMFATFLSGMIFSVDDKNNLHKLYGILPLKKTEWVTARYLYAAAIGFINLALVAAAVLIISNMLDTPFDSLTLFAFLGASLIYYCFSVGVIYPVYIRLSFSKAYIFTMLPIALIGVGVMLIARRTELSGSINGLMGFFSSNQSLILIFALCVGIIFLGISVLAACAMYRKKEL